MVRKQGEAFNKSMRSVQQYMSKTIWEGSNKNMQSLPKNNMCSVQRHVQRAKYRIIEMLINAGTCIR